MITKVGHIQNNNSQMNNKKISFGATSKDFRELSQNLCNTPRRRIIFEEMDEKIEAYGREIEKPFELNLRQPNIIPPEIANKKAKGVTLEEFANKLRKEFFACRYKGTTSFLMVPKGVVFSKVLEHMKVPNPDIIVIGKHK